jgi:hypothetical protein
MRSRTMKIALATAAFLVMCGTSFAQSPWWWQRDRDGRWGYQDRDRDGVDDRYEHGLRDGRNDRRHNRGWHPRHSSVAYMNGYRAGYGTNGGGWQGRRDNDHDRDDAWRNRGGNGPYGNGPYGNTGTYGGRYGNNVQQIAYNNGYQEGLRYGQADRNNGHSNRPGHSSTYQNGTNGYNSSYGSQTAYKHAFQDGFRAGYDRGYNSGGFRR